MAAKNPHFHVMIWCADGKTDVGYTNVTYIELIVKDPDDAIERAREMVPNKAYYHINNITEHDGSEK